MLSTSASASCYDPSATPLALPVGLCYVPLATPHAEPSPTDRNALPRAALGGGGSGGRPSPRLAGHQARRKAGGAGGARCPAVKGECPAPRRRAGPTAAHSSLTACPDHAPPATVGGGEGTRLRRVLLRWQAPQPCSTHRATPPGRRPATPTSFPTSTPTSFPTRWGCVPLASLAERIGAGQSPSWGQSAAKTAADWPPSGEWSGRAGWCASRD